MYISARLFAVNSYMIIQDARLSGHSAGRFRTLEVEKNINDLIFTVLSCMFSYGCLKHLTEAESCVDTVCSGRLWFHRMLLLVSLSGPDVYNGWTEGLSCYKA